MTTTPHTKLYDPANEAAVRPRPELLPRHAEEMSGLNEEAQECFSDLRLAVKFNRHDEARARAEKLAQIFRRMELAVEQFEGENK